MSWLTLVSLALVAFGSVHCADSDGWENVGGRFLKYYATPMNFHDANAVCYKLGGVMVHDNHPAVSAHLARRGGVQWIGATDAGHEGKWTWTNGVSVGKGNWFPGEPNNCCGGQNCAVTNFRQPGRWDDQSCAYKRPFHCQVHQVGYAYTALGRAMKVHTEKKSWQEAATACNKEGGELVVVDHPSVNAWLARQGTKNMWIGATDWGHEGKWTWSKGAAATKSYWYPGEPNNCCGGQNCAVINFLQPGKWDDQGCGIKNSFACQIKF